MVILTFGVMVTFNESKNIIAVFLLQSTHTTNISIKAQRQRQRDDKERGCNK